MHGIEFAIVELKHVSYCVDIIAAKTLSIISQKVFQIWKSHTTITYLSVSPQLFQQSFSFSTKIKAIETRSPVSDASNRNIMNELITVKL